MWKPWVKVESFESMKQHGTTDYDKWRVAKGVIYRSQEEADRKLLPIGRFDCVCTTTNSFVTIRQGRMTLTELLDLPNHLVGKDIFSNRAVAGVQEVFLKYFQNQLEINLNPELAARFEMAKDIA